MTDRIPLAQHTKASLDQLYADLDRYEEVVGELNQANTGLARKAGRAETALARVTDLQAQWLAAGSPPLGVSVSRWWDARLVELHEAIHAPADESARTTPDNPPTSNDPHIYLSTGCYHGDHAYCQAMTGLNGAKRPASCKKCGVGCICDCHQQRPAEPPVHIGGRANAEDCPACTGTNPPYPFICPGPDEAAVDEVDDLTGAQERLAQSGVDTPGCDCDHDGMGVSWHGDDCPWRRNVLDGPRPERTPSQRPGLRDDIAKAARTVPLRLGPNAIAIAQRGEAIILNMGEADHIADAVLALLHREWPWLRAAAEDATPPAAT